MIKLLKFTGILLGLFLILALTAFFVMKDPKPDFLSEAAAESVTVSLAEIQTRNSQSGMFKSAVTVKTFTGSKDYPQYFGQKIVFKESKRIDSILIGVTSNHISRIEVWEENQLINSEEKGFHGKMTWGEGQEMEVEFYDQTNDRYSGKSKIWMRFFSVTGFFGEIGSIQMEPSMVT